MKFIAALEALLKPTIAAVHGVCSSGDFELALGFDYLWAAAGTKIGFLEAMPAIPPNARGYGAIKAILRVHEQGGIVGADRITINTVAPVLDRSDANAAITTLMTRGPKALFTYIGA